MALGSTEPVTEISTRGTSLGGKGGRCVGLTAWDPEHPGTLRACPVLCRYSQGCGVGVGRNFRWNLSRKEFLGGVGVGKNVPTPTPTSV
jgi:hypothetical protein